MDYRSENNNDKDYAGQTAGALAGTILGVGILGLGLYLIFSFGRQPAATQNNQTEITFNDKYMLDNNSETANTTSSVTDLQSQVLQAGSGTTAKAGDKVTVQYTGWLTDGTKFDSSYDNGQPFQFTLGAGQVIPGWDKGIVGMQEGEKRKLTVPASLAYGATGTPGGPIPPNATLIFEVELVKIN